MSISEGAGLSDIQNSNELGTISGSSHSAGVRSVLNGQVRESGRVPGMLVAPS
jgi:hypothetical protein